ncbi:MAG: YbaK/EbsC family protein [Candidatus Levyibacteriota bacterium]
MKFGELDFQPALRQPDIIAKPVFEGIKKLSEYSQEILSAQIDPQYSDSQAFCEHYNVVPEKGANCIILEAKGGKSQFAACLVPVNSKANINSVIRKFLEAKSVSFSSREDAVGKTGMEFGSITIIGLPSEWPLLIDESLTKLNWMIIGGGLRTSKLLVPGKLLEHLPNAVLIPEMSTPSFNHQ